MRFSIPFVLLYFILSGSSDTVMYGQNKSLLLNETRMPAADVYKVIAEVEETGRLELWPGFNVKSIPVMVFDSTDTWLFFPTFTPEDFFPVPGKKGVLKYEGQHPLCRGNSIVKMGDTWIAASVFSGYSKRTGEKYSDNDLAGIIVHEQFHVFQRLRHAGWQQNDGVILFYPLETNESVFLRKLEKESFRRAVTALSENQTAGWSLTALEYRNKRLGSMPGVFGEYEKELQLTEGLSDYIEKKARKLSPLNASEITNGIAPPGVRDLGYVEGRWIAMILDRLHPRWKNILEENDTLLPEELLSSKLSEMKAGKAEFTMKEIDSLRIASDNTYNCWLAGKTKEITEYLLQPGYKLMIDASDSPFSIRIFEPLEIDLTDDGGVFHRVIFSGANQRSSIRIMNHPCITYFNGAYQLSAITIAGLKKKPVVDYKNRKCILKYDAIDIALDFSKITESGNAIRVQL